MELSPKELHCGNALDSGPGEPVSKSRSLAAFLVERRDAYHALQPEFHAIVQSV